jgi:AcrR family transcriptional regulator
VPRISAPTVAEHRAKQLATLLDAARRLLAEQGPDALTLTTLAGRVGLSRPSLYEYFRSRNELVMAIIHEDLPMAANRIRQAIHEAGPELADQMRAYVSSQIEMMADPGLAALIALGSQALSTGDLQHVSDAHAVLVEPLATVLTDAGLPNPTLRATLIQGVVEAAARSIEPGRATATAEIIDAAVDQILHGVGTSAT